VDDCITRLLKLWAEGDADALHELMPLLYSQLRDIAAGVVSGQVPGQTLPATALVHEAFLRLSGTTVDWQNRGHFLAVAGRVMRRVLVDHARLRGRYKRGGGLERVDFDEALILTPEPPEVLLDLDDALNRLESFDERKSRIVEMMYFGGMTHEEAAEVLGISRATVQREARLAKVWLYSELQGRQPE